MISSPERHRPRPRKFWQKNRFSGSIFWLDLPGDERALSPKPNLRRVKLLTMNIRLSFTVGHHGYRWQTDEWFFVLAKVVEDLPFIHDREVSGKFNRVTHPFNYRALLTAIEREEPREGGACRQVLPAHPSIIGRFKYPPPPVRHHRP